MENLGKCTLFVIMMALKFCLGILTTYIVLDLAGLYKLQFITQFAFIQAYGIIVILNILRFTITSQPDKKDVVKKHEKYIDKIGITFVQLITAALFYLMAWGFGYLAHAIIS